MAGDWIRLYRQIEDSAVWQDPDLLRFWLWLLLRATWKPKQLLDGTMLQPGQLPFGSRNASEILKLGRQRIRHFVDTLELLGNITRKSTHHGTIISICQWSTYQNREDDDQPTVNPPSTHRQPTVNPPSTHIEEGKKGRREEGKTKKGAAAPLPPLPDGLGSSEDFCLAWTEWQAHRREIRKPLTPTAAKQQLDEFAAWGPARAIAAIRHTIRKGWQGIREPETTGQSAGNGQFIDFELMRSEAKKKRLEEQRERNRPKFGTSEPQGNQA